MTVGGFKKEEPALVNAGVEVGRRLVDRADPSGVGMPLIL
jgi:hypothetical protein